MAELVTSSYDFVAPRQIAFGWGRRKEAGKLARQLGRRVFLVCGSRTIARQGFLGEIVALLKEENLEIVGQRFISREPLVEDVDQTAEEIRAAGLGNGLFVLAIGGGSAIDLAKAAAAIAPNANGHSVKDYLEGVGIGLKLENDPLPVMAMPTTAGTGAEATKNAVVSSFDPPFKRSLRDNRMVPRIALIDPELTVPSPPEVTAASGMDAITQLVESYISRKARPIPQALAVQGLQLALDALPLAVANGQDRQAREKMAHAALLSGMALANAGLGLAHGISPALGVIGRVPHGSSCALLLPVALRVNAETMPGPIAELARRVLPNQLPDDDTQAAAVFIERIEQLCEQIKVPRRLSEVGISREQIPAVVATKSTSSMSGNPRELTDEQLCKILEGIL